MSAPESHLTKLLVRGGTAWVRQTLARLERGEGNNPDLWRELAGYAMEVTRHLEPPAEELQGALSPSELLLLGQCPDCGCMPCRCPIDDVSGMAYDD